MLIAIKLLHTLVWALLAGCIFALPVLAFKRRFGWAVFLSAIILVECGVVAFNRGRCPLTNLAARFTTDRADNFDIYLPLGLARYNKKIFGAILVLNETIALVCWLRQARIRRGLMTNIKGALSLLTVILSMSLIAVSCSTQQSQLQSLIVDPATADAQNYSNGKVQFTATGNYVHPSRTVTPQPANWAACQNGTPTADVSVTASGIAQCASGAVGQFPIHAWDARSGQGVVNCTAITACGGGCTIEASAQLTCP